MDKRIAKLEYKHSHHLMGVFQIRNTVNEKLLVASSINIPGKINRIRFQLNANSHPSKRLQAEWNEFGESAFEFETLEPVNPRDDPNYDHAADVEFLEDLWLERLEPYGDKGYNERKKTREDRLRMIASKNRPI